VDPYKLTASEAAKQIKEGELTPVKLAESLLKRIELLEPILEAWVSLDPQEVMDNAMRATKEAEENIFKSPLHGIPVGVKDIYYTSGTRTTMGSPIYKDLIPEYDADTVKFLKEAGMVILGKTETTEFAVHDPAPTRNPWNTEHTPGGSSSGSAAAVCSGMCQLALGSQTGGSVVRPASYCGIVGVKPSYDYISKSGVYPLSWSLDHVGFFSRSVHDSSLFLQVLAGENISDDRDRPPRIGLLSGYFKENSERDIWTGLEKSIGRLWGEGADIIDVMLPKSFKMVQDVHRVIMSVETAAVHEDNFRVLRDMYRVNLKGLISSGLLVPATAYLRAQRLRRTIIDDLLSVLRDYDCFVCPSSLDTAPHGLESTGNSAFNNPWSLSGLPSVTVPLGLAPNGMPLGLQLIGHPFREAELLGVAKWCESVIGFSNLPKDPFTP
jgi:aspartyl-tRNA(Asn)/glutamyl-tRNA(Gln) amidotransferase subunit A